MEGAVLCESLKSIEKTLKNFFELFNSFELEDYHNIVR